MLRRPRFLALAAILLPFLAGSALGQTVQPRSGIPTITIGDGISSFGDLNTDGVRGGDDDDRVFARAISSLPSAGGVVAVGAGTYYFDRWVNVTADNVRLVLAAGATLIPNHSGSVGLFRVYGVRGFSLEGGGVLVDQPFGDQTAIKIDNADDCEVISMVATVSTAVMTSSNPYTVFEVTGGSERALLRRLKVHPNAGVRCVRLYNATAPEVFDFYAGPVSGTTPRLCWRGIDIDGGSRVALRDIRLAYLGTTAAPLAHAIRSYENDFAAGGQDGDRYTGLDIDTVSCRTMLHLIGRKGLQVTNSRFRAGNTAICNTNNYVDRFDAAILIDNVDESESADQDNKYAAHIKISECEFDGAAGMGASDIYVRSCAKAELENTRHVHSTSRYAVTVDADHSIDVSVRGPYFDGQYNASTRPTQYHPILVINRLAAPTTTTIGAAQVTSFAFGSGTGVITAASGDLRNYVEAGNYVTIASADESGNNLASATLVSTVTETTMTLVGVAFTADASDVNAVITVVPELADSGQNGGTALWQEIENVTVSGALAEGYLLTLPALSGGYGVFPPTIGARGSYWPMGVDGYETYVGSTSISFTGPATVTGTGLFGGVSAGDYVMILGPTNEENWGVRRVQAADANSLTLFNPNYQNNSDPTITGTALSNGSGFTSLAFGSGTGVITRTGGSDWSTTLKPGMFLTVDATLSANDVTTPAMITASTSTTVTLQGVTFTSASGDTGAVLTPSNGGWSLVSETAGATVEVFVFKRGISEIGFSRPLSTNVAGRRIR